MYPTQKSDHFFKETNKLLTYSNYQLFRKISKLAGAEFVKVVEVFFSREF